MQSIFVFVLLTGLAGAAAVRFRRSVAETLAPACFGYILVLYFCGMVGALEAGVWLCVALGGVATVWLGIQLLRQKRAAVQWVLCPALLVFAALCALAWVWQRTRLFAQWDEFSHWGLVVKNMVALGQLGNDAAATTIFPTYPPAASLFQYLLCMLHGGFSEAIVYRAMNVLCFALLMPVLGRLRWRAAHLPAAMGLCAAVLLLPMTLYLAFYMEIYVDALLGLLLFFLLYTWFSEQQHDAFSLWRLGLTAMVLALTKVSGAGLAVLAAGIVLADTLRTPCTPQAGARGLRLLPALTVLTGAAAGALSWQIYLHVTSPQLFGAVQAARQGGSLWAVLAGHGAAYQYETMRNFFAALFSLSFYDYTAQPVHMTTFLWLVLAALLGVWLVLGQREAARKRRMATVVAATLCGFVVYLLSLLVLYTCSFSAYEAVRLSSFPRYVCTYLLGMTALFLFLLLDSALAQPALRGRLLAFPAVLAVLLFLTDPESVTFLSTRMAQRVQQTQEARAPYATLEALGTQLDPSTDRVYFVAQGTQGYEQCVARYALTPVHLSEHWSLGTPYGPEDIWTQPIACADWRAQLAAEYTYVYLFAADEHFAAQYAAAFETPADIAADTLFTVVRQNGSCVLRAVE